MGSSLYTRIQGGEKNLKSGEKWSREEIIEVYRLYKKLNGVGLHEHNPEIIALAGKLGRTVRSTEAQTLMFRNLDKDGDYSHGNMSNLTRAIWHEFEGLKQLDGQVSGHEQEEITIDFEDDLNYFEWNQRLVNYYFKEDLKNYEIPCIPVSEDIFQIISDGQFLIDDFISSLKKEIGSSVFFTKLEQLHRSSLPIQHENRLIRKSIPEYFGFLIFIIYALSDDEGTNMSVTNVYDRINHYGNRIFQNNWSNLNSIIARDLLEPLWQNLEEWSCDFKKGNLGKFVRYNPEKLNRKYVSRIERHAIFNSRQFAMIIDLLIDDGFSSTSLITLEEWRAFFLKHKMRLPKANLILHYLSEQKELQKSVVAFLNSYTKQHFTKDTISSNQAEFRTPPIPLKLCISELPTWPGAPIEKFHFRAVSDILEEDSFYDGIKEHRILLQTKDMSERLFLDIDLSVGRLFTVRDRRYVTNKEIFWLTKDHLLGEWVEVDNPSNEMSFVLVINKSKLDKFDYSTIPGIIRYELQGTKFIVLKFNNIDENSFDIIYSLYNPYGKIEGKIELITEFASDRRRCIYREFSPRFRYIGPTALPKLEVISNDNTGRILCDLILCHESNNLYEFPQDFDYNEEFRIQEAGTYIKSRTTFYFGSLSKVPINISKPALRDGEGKILRDFIPSDGDIMDIPEKFNRNLDIVRFNQWHKDLFPLFKGKKNLNADLDEGDNFRKLSSKGDLMLEFMGITTNMSTYDFPRLLAELNPKVELKYAKRIMGYWRHLGYLNFQNYGDPIKISPTSLLFLQTQFGLRGFLSGYRNRGIMEKIWHECDRMNIQICINQHSGYFGDLYPSRIILYDKRGDLEKFHQLKKNLRIEFLNDIQNAYNTRYVVYQLAALYTQKTVNEFNADLKDGLNYHTDHHRKRLYNPRSLNWIETTQSVDRLEDGSVVRYDGFRNREVIHIIRYNNTSRIIHELNLALFSTLKDNVFAIRECDTEEYFDLYVPLGLGLPYWIEKGLLLLNAEIPNLKYLDGGRYRVYEKIHVKILKVLETQLNQKINLP